MSVKPSLALILACLAALPAAAEKLYKSVGPDGRIVYSDRPPSDAKTVKSFTVMSLPASPVPPSAQTPSPSASPGLPVGDGVTLFSADWCGYCRRAKAYLAEKGIGYREYNIDTPDGQATYRQAGGGGSVPLLLYQGRKVQGFTPDGYDRFFAAR
ncbi:MAG: DUF4124 domain-containing protein [Pseudomonadota bacterium]